MVRAIYFDTSALLKRYIAETGSRWTNTLISSPDAPAVFTSHLTAVEATCAFARRLRERTLSTAEHTEASLAFDYDMTYRYNVLDVIPVTVETARQLARQHPLRAYDAMQLATAWLLNQELLRAGDSPLVFISADDRLLAIAQAEGLNNDNPNHHP
jgi:predicted nucleic acid-binding protein